MQSDFEAMGGTYTQVGDYLLPDVEAPESPQIGIWGERRRKYLQKHEKSPYQSALSATSKATASCEAVAFDILILIIHPNHNYHDD